MFFFFYILLLVGCNPVNSPDPEKGFYSIEIICGPNGSTPSNNLMIEEGKDVTVPIIAASGYEVDVLKVDGVVIPSSDSVKFSNISAHHTIEVSFKKILGKFKISLLIGANGITPSCDIIVTESKDTVVSFAAASGYKVDVLKVDGVVIPSANSVKFMNVSSDHKVEVTFKKKDAFDFLILKPWNLSLEQKRDVGTEYWYNFSIPANAAEKYVFFDSYRFNYYMVEKLVGDGNFILKQDSLIIGPNKEGYCGLRCKIVLSTSDSLVIRRVSKFIGPEKLPDTEIQDTFVH